MLNPGAQSYNVHWEDGLPPQSCWEWPQRFSCTLIRKAMTTRPKACMKQRFGKLSSQNKIGLALSIQLRTLPGQVPPGVVE